ncbi:hypothetical protein [Nocardia jejuensis]|uniref:hypothetical protein n=1 Tax=Nocardia jejuensis TaxID=328049 RepID=UPI0012FA0BA6|nr:hypothetical protein [Nocardia jejuensis]
MRSRLPAAIRNAAVWSRRFARTAPGAIGAMGAGLIVLALISGLVCSNQLGDKTSRRDTVLHHTEPLANASQRLYVALSAADAAASTAFLSGGIESPEVRTQYRQSLADAAAALAEATTGASDADTRQIVARISAELPTYTGLVEAARANNRQGLPVGSAYLRQASALMQDSVLKNAEELQQSRLAQLREDQNAISGLPWSSLVVLMLFLLACGAGSRVLLRRTNRWINPGVAAAAGVTLLAMLWIVIAEVAAGATIDSAATTRFESLSRARILAQQARTEETLQLIIRGDLDASEQRFGNDIDDLRTRLLATAGPDSAATQAFTSWQDGHKTQVAAYRSNNYKGAVQQAVGSGDTTSAARFNALDESLRAELEQARAQVRDGADGAGDALTLISLGTFALMVAAAAAIGLGVWPRLKEFL